MHINKIVLCLVPCMCIAPAPRLHLPQDNNHVGAFVQHVLGCAEPGAFAVRGRDGRPSCFVDGAVYTRNRLEGFCHCGG